MKNRLAVYTGAVALMLGLNFGLAALIRPDVTGWYAGLEKSAFTPPGYIFGIVWTLIYLMLGAVLARLWLAWRKLRGASEKFHLALFGFQAGLNVLWPVIFFKLHIIALAFFWTVLLAGLLIFWLVRLVRYDRVVFALVLPYGLWSCYAIYLSYGIWSLNG